MKKWCYCLFWRWLIILAVMLNGGLAMASIMNTKHNLSTDGAGSYRASAEQRVCLMCHTPHSGDPAVPLWNHTLSAATYTPYSSTTLNAAPGQPTGSSKLCLSCHDGTVAIGSLVNMPGSFGEAPEVYSGIISGLTDTLMLSPTNIGDDLSDDHPISFVYDNALASITGELKNPLLIPEPIKLEGGEVQCTSCHEPHSDDYPMFLRMSFTDGADFGSQLCLACHKKDGWLDVGNKHRESVATWNLADSNPWHLTALDVTLDTVQKNACESCHRSHGGLSNKRLLKQGGDEAVCLVCHGGSDPFLGNVSDGGDPTFNIQTYLEGSKYAHPITAYSGRHLPIRETIGVIQGVVREDKDNFGATPGTRHSECPDCHNPHFAKAGVSPNAEVSATDNTRSDAYEALEGVWGVTPISWPLSNWGTILRSQYAEVDNATQQYQICLKCHSDYAYDGATPPYSYASGFPGYVLTDQGREFNPNNASYHRVTDTATIVPNDFIMTVGATPYDYGSVSAPPFPSLLQGFTATSKMNCSDCHSDPDGMGAAPTGPKGPHGSDYPFILRAPWTQNTGQASYVSDHLCFECHVASVYTASGSILNWQNTGFSGTGLMDGSCGSVAGQENLHVYHSCKKDTPCMACHAAVPHGFNKASLLVFGRDIGSDAGADPEPYNRNSTRRASIGGLDYGIPSDATLTRLGTASAQSGNWIKSDCHTATGVGTCSP
ncbi:Cytochrome c family protein [hydrothermal vent metagenome]|uniref:Cytochrome c family protein n=1 Tax=hydrothermal vent metagenome TaxID=652676 RepID=A0A3B1B9J7_9ZZZZ